jgi:hypothetical protein
MDCLSVLYATNESAKVAQSKYLSAKEIGNTEKSIGTEEGKLLYRVKWEDAVSNRAAVSVPDMKKMLDSLYNTTPMSAKLSEIIDHTPLTVSNANLGISTNGVFGNEVTKNKSNNHHMPVTLKYITTQLPNTQLSLDTDYS